MSALREELDDALAEAFAAEERHFRAVGRLMTEAERSAEEGKPGTAPPLAERLELCGSSEEYFREFWRSRPELMIAAGVTFLATFGRLPLGRTSESSTTEFWNSNGLPVEEAVIDAHNSVEQFNRLIFRSAPAYGVRLFDRAELQAYLDDPEATDPLAAFQAQRFHAKGIRMKLRLSDSEGQAAKVTSRLRPLLERTDPGKALHAVRDAGVEETALRQPNVAWESVDLTDSLWIPPRGLSATPNPADEDELSPVAKAWRFTGLVEKGTEVLRDGQLQQLPTDSLNVAVFEIFDGGAGGEFPLVQAESLYVPVSKVEAAYRRGELIPAGALPSSFIAPDAVVSRQLVDNVRAAWFAEANATIVGESLAEAIARTTPPAGKASGRAKAARSFSAESHLRAAAFSIGREVAKGRDRVSVNWAPGVEQASLVKAAIAEAAPIVGRGDVLVLTARSEVERTRASYHRALGTAVPLSIFDPRTNTPVPPGFVIAPFDTAASVQLEPDRFTYVIVQDFHHGEARRAASAIKKFQAKLSLGTTADPRRNAARPLDQWFGDSAYTLTVPGAVAAKLLTPIDYQLATEGNVTLATGQIASTIRRSSTGNQRIFIEADSFDRAWRLQRQLGGELMNSHRSASDNRRALQRFLSGDSQILISFGVFGTKVPAADSYFFVNLDQSVLALRQRIGSAAQRIPGRELVRIVDFPVDDTRVAAVDRIFESPPGLERSPGTIEVRRLDIKPRPHFETAEEAVAYAVALVTKPGATPHVFGREEVRDLSTNDLFCNTKELDRLFGSDGEDTGLARFQREMAKALGLDVRPHFKTAKDAVAYAVAFEKSQHAETHIFTASDVWTAARVRALSRAKHFCGFTQLMGLLRAESDQATFVDFTRAMAEGLGVNVRPRFESPEAVVDYAVKNYEVFVDFLIASGEREPDSEVGQVQAFKRSEVWALSKADLFCSVEELELLFGNEPGSSGLARFQRAVLEARGLKVPSKLQFLYAKDWTNAVFNKMTEGGIRRGVPPSEEILAMCDSGELPGRQGLIWRFGNKDLQSAIKALRTDLQKRLKQYDRTLSRPARATPAPGAIKGYGERKQVLTPEEVLQNIVQMALDRGPDKGPVTAKEVNAASRKLIPCYPTTVKMLSDPGTSNGKEKIDAAVSAAFGIQMQQRYRSAGKGSDEASKRQQMLADVTAVRFRLGITDRNLTPNELRQEAAKQDGSCPSITTIYRRYHSVEAFLDAVEQYYSQNPSVALAGANNRVAHEGAFLDSLAG